MSDRIAPDLNPAGGPPLRAKPSGKARLPGAAAGPRSAGLFVWLLRLLLAGIALVLLSILALRWVPPPTSAFMLQSEVQPVRYSWVPADRIADVARRAVIAAEDQKFRTHNGFDVEAIEKAYEHNKNAGRHRRGASTISQQTAKNIFLWSGGGYFRKGIEAGLTILIEKLWGKDRILEVYLNVAEFGPGIYGVEAASQAFFGKPAARLTPEEAATLASVLPNPRHWNVRSPGPYVKTRIAWVLGQMGYGHAGTPAEEPEPSAADFAAGSGEGAVADPRDTDTSPPAPEPSVTPMPLDEVPSANDSGKPDSADVPATPVK
jgi:monofunctional biosynthetic peptidoglycan transglycosylase